ncbi:MAG: flagellar biosynthesis protein FlhF [Lachnospiraceae bacterium]|nr:flagellar biosynthesis protein FlhF [Lachnospiraceae bacterium]
MIIKKFQAKTESEAVEAARKELGTNVVVMNVKSVKRKGIFSFFSPQLTEVTVALEDDTDKAIQQKVNSRNVTEALGKVNSIVERAEKNAAEAPAPVKRPQPAADTSKAEEESAKPVTYERPRTTSGNVLEEKLDSIQNMIAEKLAPESDKAKEPEKTQGRESDKQSEEDDELKTFFSLLKTTLEDNEVNRDYAAQIVDDAAKTTKPGTPFDVVLAGIYQKMILKFGKSEVISPAENGPKVVFFVGPTGVGKTTTIAKIASKFSVEQKKKIALLTADTYRIAAAEQLRTYASILEVPFRIIYTIDEMQSALDDFSSFDYVFVDTAGHSHQNREQKNIMGEFIHSIDGVVEKEVYLVVSATTKYRDLKSIADAYSEITDYKLIFTKLDETTALGNLLNLKLYTDASLSYITCGQNVPDDIEDFNAQRTVKNLLGGKR